MSMLEQMLLSMFYRNHASLETSGTNMRRCLWM